VLCERNIKITHASGDISADTLGLLLTLEDRQGTPLDPFSRHDANNHPATAGLPAPPPPSTLDTPLPLPVHLAAIAMAATQTAQAHESTHETITDATDPGRVTVTWSGRMTLIPIDEPPTDAPLDEIRNGAVFATLTGRPITITTQQSDRMTAASLDYLTTSGTLRVIGSKTFPLVIDSAQRQLRIDGQMLVVNRDNAQASLVGPGRLRSLGQKLSAVDAGDANWRGSTDRLPPGMSIQ